MSAPKKDKQFSTSLQKLLFAAGLLFTSLYAVAAPTPVPGTEGIERAEKMCQAMGFPNEVLKCVRAVKGAKYFEPAAVDVCADRAFPSEKQVCLETIRDQQYTTTGIETCKSMGFSSKIVDCLKEAGKTFVVMEEKKDKEKEPVAGQIAQPALPYVKDEVRRAIRQLEAGNSRRARLILKDLLDETRTEND